MNRYFIIMCWSAVFSCFFSFQIVAQMKQQTKKPNIIFILTDDLGYGDLGVLYQNQRKSEGKPFHSTPSLDKMANEGILLTRHYVPAPVCAPSRASLLLGVHQGHADIRNNQFDKALPDNHTLASVLKEAGYATALIGKYGLQGLEGNSPETWEAYPTKRGFDHFFGYVRHRDGHNHYPAHHAPERTPVELYSDNQEISKQLKGAYTTDLFTAKTKQWIIDHKQSKADQPFFIYLAYNTPHAGLQVASTPYPAGGGIKGGVKWIGKHGNYINTVSDSVDNYIHPDYDNKDWPDVQKRIASMVRRIDDGIGDIMQLLKDLNIDEETLVVFSSDNGPHHESYGYGNYAPTFFENYGPLDGTKRDTWEGGIRVPTIVRWPGKIPAGTKNDTPFGFYDWMPTFANVANISVPAITDGVSLLPTLTDQGEQKPGRVYIEYSVGGETPDYPSFHETHKGQKRGEMQVIYVEGYKGVRYDIKSADDNFRIFDTKKDPKEINNLAGTSDYFRELQQKMKDQVLRIRRPNSSAERPYDKKPIPAMQPDKKTANGGLSYRLFQVKSSWVPKIEQAQELKKGRTHGFDASSIVTKGANVVELRGFIHVPRTGEYKFTLKTDGKVIMHLHDALLIDGDKGFSGGTLNAVINLEMGFHPVQIIYLNDSLDVKSIHSLEWSGPDFAQKSISSDVLYYFEK